MRYHSEKEVTEDNYWQKVSYWQDEYTGLFFVVSSVRHEYADETMIFLAEAQGSDVKVISYRELDVKPSDICHNTLMETWKPCWHLVCAILRGTQ
jgi:hypothetical protein